MSMPLFPLNGYTFDDLRQTEGLQRLDRQFLDYLKNTQTTLYDLLLLYRNGMTEWTPLSTSEFLLAVAPLLENFLIDLFDIQEAAALAQAKTVTHNPIAAFKAFFVVRRAKKQLLKTDDLPPFATCDAWLSTALANAPLTTTDPELAVSLLAQTYLAAPEQHADNIEKLTQWCRHALITADAKQKVSGWSAFHLPERLDYTQLVKCIKTATLEAFYAAPEDQLRLRDGFTLTDPRMTVREAQDEINYCIYCHDHDGDFCSKGFPVKKGDPAQGFKKNPLGVTLTGCPLDEKISEMHLLKRDGLTLAALAMIMIDNPLCPATGHRICNDCMKACIYQKQEPVNIPQTETRILTDVLDLPWGVEIYDLLTRWHPLRQKQWIMKPYNGLKILIAGMGPAGFTLAHHLLLEGFAVVGFDGLKIEPLPSHLINNPIYCFDELKEALDERIMAGFGGVAEYGITVRWDKNFLKLIYLSLMRKPYFQVFGSIRFGGTLTVHDAWTMGFDHFVIAVGAGLPKALPIPGSLAPGMRQANDFLMALQLGNAAKKSSLTNIQVRLPAVVIGGGLTGVDTATEIQAYYITQVEKILHRYEILAQTLGEEAIINPLDAASREILSEYLAHGKAVRQERARASAEKTRPNFIPLLRAWGGVTIVYRRTLQESPAYINNHEELNKALAEGIFYLEALEPVSTELNAYGHVETLICRRRLKTAIDEWETTTEECRLPARAIFVATGTHPNIAYEFEHRGTFQRQGLQYQHYENIHDELVLPHGVEHCKDPNFGPFTSYTENDYRVSLIGDTHPVFHGNVVKAIASGMRTYPKIVAALAKKLGNEGDQQAYRAFAKKMHGDCQAIVDSIKRVAPHILELTVHAPMAARHFQPGQFYRLQNYETTAQRVHGTTLQMEPLALVAMDCDLKKETLTFMIHERGTSTKVCATLKPGELVSLMGPTGVRAKLSHQQETVLILGDVMSLPLLKSYGTALRKTNNRVIYLGLLTDDEKTYCLASFQQAADVIKTSNHYSLNILEQYATSHPTIPLSDVDRIYVIGSADILRQFQEARSTWLTDYLIKQPCVYGSVYSTMQCMLKGVCAQCLQWQIDPDTGKRTKAVFACSWPDQPLELIDIGNIDERFAQNHLQEHLSRLWVDYVFEQGRIERV